jgi:chromosome segregation ATPase
MKNTLILILLCFALLGWGVVIYQNAKFTEASKKIEESVLQQVDHLWNTYRSIRNDVDTREKEKSFLLQQESSRELQEALLKRIDESQMENENFRTQLEANINQQLQEFLAKDLAYQNQIAEFKKSLAEVNQALAALKESNSGLDKKLSEFKVEAQDSRGELEKDLRDEINSLAAQQKDLVRKLEDYSDRLDDLAAAKTALPEGSENK